MRPTLLAVAVNALTIGALPAAGAYLLGLSSSAHRDHLPLARVTITPVGMQSPLTIITMSQASVQWEEPATADVASVDRAVNFPWVLDITDTNGRHYGGYGIGCWHLTATVARCTLTYPDARHHAPWATVVLGVASAERGNPLTLIIHPG